MSTVRGSGQVRQVNATPIPTLLSFIVFALLCGSVVAAEKPSIQGVWRVEEMRALYADGRTRDLVVQENLVIFTDTHYTQAYAVGDKSAQPEKRFKLNDVEKVQRYSRISVNTGTYSLDGSTLIVHPTFSQNPDYVGGEGIYDYVLAGDTLTLTWKMITAADGAQYPFLAAGGRLVLKLQRTK